MHENFFHKVKVYYEDTDSGGVVYYANYLKFLERARTEALYSIGYSNNKIFWNSLDISLSIPGVIYSRYSITVTSEPNLDHTDPISKPIYPPPITASFFGTLLSDKAPVEETVTQFLETKCMVGPGIEAILTENISIGKN